MRSSRFLCSVFCSLFSFAIFSIFGLSVVAQSSFSGKGVKVAIIDSGMDMRLPELKDQVVGGYDYVANLPVSQLTDPDGHGTRVAKVVQQMAPDAKLLIYRVLDDQGCVSCINLVIQAIRQAEADGADVINMSLGFDRSPKSPLIDAVNDAVKKEIVVVVAAGNEGLDGVDSPGTSSEAITVGATKAEEGGGPFYIVNWSSRGPMMNMLSIKPDVVAPGKNVKLQLKRQKVEFSGTSAAAPHVAGVCALLKEAHPEWTPRQIKAALSNNAISLNDEMGDPLDCFTQGAGLVDLDTAVKAETLIYPNSLSFGYVGRVSVGRKMVRSLTLENQSTETKTYRMQSFFNTSHPGVNITVPRKVTVPAKGKKRVWITITPTASKTEVYTGRIEFIASDQSMSIPFAIGMGDAPFGVESELLEAEETQNVKKARQTSQADSWVKPNRYDVHLYLPSAVDVCCVTAVPSGSNDSTSYPIYYQENLDKGACGFTWNGKGLAGNDLPEGKYKLKAIVYKNGEYKDNNYSRVFISRTPPRFTELTYPARGKSIQLKGIVEQHSRVDIYEFYWKKSSTDQWNRAELKKIKPGKYRFYLTKDQIQFGDEIDLKVVDERGSYSQCRKVVK